MSNKIPSPKDVDYYDQVLTQPDNISSCNVKNCDIILGLYPKYCFVHTLQKYNLYISNSCIPNVGMGLFAGPKGFKKGDIIGKYSSKHNRITYGELLEKNKNCLNTNERTKYILCDIPKKNQNQLDVMCWDGLDIRSTILRFINDSYNTKLKNNTYFTIKNDEAYVIASENIKPFHELYISYGTKYWD
jgi:hypothetical protein